VGPEKKSESDQLLDFVQYKPWRASKIKNLPICYRPWKESYLEKYRTEDDETIYLYSIPRFKPSWEKTRIDELWHFPWLWTKIKAERLSYLHKQFYADCDAMTAQEHIEMDCFFSEFDMPTRWGLLRLKEFDVLNVAALWLVFLTDFTAIKPTDLGLRPDGSVRTCPVQFHNCISSSANPLDSDHFAPPFKWSRSKSPQQAYEEVKSVYFNYPKRGLRWSYGWIDRGGWKPQLFGGSYFYAQAESLAFHYADDVELMMDFDKREVQYRSSTRIGQHDWDVERLRYNQFVRMLEAKGGWEVHPLDRLYYLSKTPYRWTQFALDTASRSVEKSSQRLLDLINSASAGEGDTADLTATIASVKKVLADMYAAVQPLVMPVLTSAEDLQETIRLDPRVASALHSLGELQELVDHSLETSLQRSQVGAVLDQVTSLLKSFEKSGDVANMPPMDLSLSSSSDGKSDDVAEMMNAEDLGSQDPKIEENQPSTSSLPSPSSSSSFAEEFRSTQPPSSPTRLGLGYSNHINSNSVVIDRDIMRKKYLQKPSQSMASPTTTSMTQPWRRDVTNINRGMSEVESVLMDTIVTSGSELRSNSKKLIKSIAMASIDADVADVVRRKLVNT